jgi:hypothetical protein
MSGGPLGVIPPMTTPFDPDGEIDQGAVRAQTRWRRDQGAPIPAVCAPRPRMSAAALGGLGAARAAAH